MATTEHTPGPWKYDETLTGDHTCPIYTDGAWIATAFMGHGLYHGDIQAADAEVLANARLIAAAPALLRALKNVLRYCVTPTGMPDKNKGRTEEQQRAFDSARAAIALATGS
jgi:hypothetical protein